MDSEEINHSDTEMDSVNGFSEDYLTLKPTEASLVDVFTFILPSASNKIKNLIDCPDGKEHSYTNFKARWTIFVTILLQKFLLAIATPLAILGATRSTIRRLFFKFLIGEVYMAVPIEGDSFAPEFRAEVNCKEWQILMDVNLADKDSTFKYYGALTMMASKLAYQDNSLVQSVVNDCWKMNLIRCSDFRNDFQGRDTTHAFMFQNTAIDPNVTVVAFRGTNLFEANDWMVDFNFSWYKINGIGNIHSGFMQALGLQKATGWPKPEDLPKSQRHFAYYAIRQKLRDIAKANPNAKFIITGHSLGGALATLFVTLLAHHNDSTILNKLQAVYTYGQPRVGDQQFAEFMVQTVQKYGIQYYRYVYSFDLVPRVPFDSLVFKYKHFGGCVYFDCFYNGKFLMEQPNRNYFSLIWVIPKYLSAWWELIRSLIVIPVVKGWKYFEGFFTILERVFGLLIPGISAHTCPNYVNLTRWGEIKLLSDNNETLRLRHIEADY